MAGPFTLSKSRGVPCRAKILFFCPEAGMGSCRFRLVHALFLMLALPGAMAWTQEMPKTAGETLSGKRMVLADEVRGHPAVLVAGFSRAGGNGTGAWVKAIRGDSALAGIAVYEIAQIAGAP